MMGRAVTAALVMLLLTGVQMATGAQALAAGQQLTLNAFFGRWQGTAMAESDLSVYFRLTVRDLDVLIRPSGAGFTVSWTTVQREKGDPAQPTLERKTTEISFVPSAMPGVWRQEGVTDPLEGPYAWARLQDSTLTVNNLVINEAGGFELQVYERTLSDTGMELRFSRLENGEQVRQARGRLIKVADK